MIQMRRKDTYGPRSLREFSLNIDHVFLRDVIQKASVVATEGYSVTADILSDVSFEGIWVGFSDRVGNDYDGCFASSCIHGWYARFSECICKLFERS